MGFNSGFKGLKQNYCALVGVIKDWMSQKMHGTTVEKKEKKNPILKNIIIVPLSPIPLHNFI